MSFVRLHCIPNKCKTNSDLTFKQKYILRKSYARYILTKDGKYIHNLNTLTGEIGSMESFRFIIL